MLSRLAILVVVNLLYRFFRAARDCAIGLMMLNTST
jgi:hypothetical protein